ncbi:hypothetical protein L13192_04599 [Pyrenophora tritici-repentis]|nr:hypothetical protein L13192_04599 [Pyrenophora tritici-repentis]KAI1684980.1 hypothetical protein KJE20_05264 [Pyrenophora tritici-repentis]
MSSTLEYYQRTPMRRSQRQKYYVRESPISFLDESYDREQHVVLGGKDRASRRQRPLYDNALERSAPEIESYPLVEYGSFIHLVMTHSFRFSVLAIVVCFLAQTPIGLATLLLFLLAISSLYFYINSVESTSRRYTKAYGSEALYRGKSPDYLLRGSSSEYEEDSEYSEDSEDSEYSEDSEDSEGYPVDVADPNHGNPAWPRRTFIEAISDTVPRMVFGFFAFLSSALYFEVNIKLGHLLFLRFIRNILNFRWIVTFYRDWIVVILGVIWSYVMGPVVRGIAIGIFGGSTRSLHGQDASHTSGNEVSDTTPIGISFWHRL